MIQNKKETWRKLVPKIWLTLCDVRLRQLGDQRQRQALADNFHIYFALNYRQLCVMLQQLDATIRRTVCAAIQSSPLSLAYLIRAIESKPICPLTQASSKERHVARPSALRISFPPGTWHLVSEAKTKTRVTTPEKLVSLKQFK